MFVTYWFVVVDNSVVKPKMCVLSLDNIINMLTLEASQNKHTVHVCIYVVKNVGLSVDCMCTSCITSYKYMYTLLHGVYIDVRQILSSRKSKKSQCERCYIHVANNVYVYHRLYLIIGVKFHFHYRRENPC